MKDLTKKRNNTSILLFIIAIGMVLSASSMAAKTIIINKFETTADISTTQTQWLWAQGIRGVGEFASDYVEVGNSGVHEFADGKTSNVYGAFSVDSRTNYSIVPTFRMGWSSPETSGNVVWKISYQKLIEGENSATAAVTVVYLNSTVGATANGIKIEQFDFNGDFNSSHVCIPVKVERIGTNSSDTLSGAANIHGMCISQSIIIS